MMEVIDSYWLTAGTGDDDYVTDLYQQTQRCFEVPKLFYIMNIHINILFRGKYSLEAISL